MPPPALRRPVSIALWLCLSLLYLALSPALLALGELVSAIGGDRRPALISRMLLAYFWRELTTLVACGGIWLLAGCGTLMHTGRVRALHWRLLRWFVGGIAGSVLGQLRIQVVDDPGSQAAAHALEASGPLLVLSRHAGPADTILLVDRLVRHFGRRPSVVFKEAIALDPSIDLIAHRLPHAVLDVDDPAECEERIARAAAALGPSGALLLFPEGGNFTPQRRRAALRSLRRRHRDRAASAAERMQHVLPPRPTGTVTALRANPSADVVFAAHTGLGLAAYPLEIWRSLPVDGKLRTRMWLVPRAEVPTDEAAISRWLNEWWLRIDRWIDLRGEE